MFRNLYRWLRPVKVRTPLLRRSRFHPLPMVRKQ
jgi:hypothetical protein